MKTVKETTVVLYKSRKYNLLWEGKTKFGQRAKLAFLDGSKEFWVPSELVSEAPLFAPNPYANAPRSFGARSGSNNATGGRSCDICGSRGCDRAWNSSHMCEQAGG
jgi:hypothetical protein